MLNVPFIKVSLQLILLDGRWRCRLRVHLEPDPQPQPEVVALAIDNNKTLRYLTF